MQFLIQAEWVQQEAADQDIKVTDARGQEVLRGPEEAGLPEGQADYKQFLARLGHDRGGHPLPRQARPASAEAHAEGHRGRKKVSDADIEEYYEKNKKRFAQPERRDLRVVLTKTEAKANQAKQALESAASRFKKVVKQYSIDEASKAQARQAPGGHRGPAGEGVRRRRSSRRRRASSRARSRPSSAGTSSRSRRSRRPRSRRSSRPRRRSRTCCARSASRRRSTSSSRTSARS